jgi:hypothetical protein
VQQRQASAQGLAHNAIAWMVPAIPYRTDAAVSTGTFVVALLITIVMLVLLAGLLLVARRRGWLAMPGRIRPPATQEGIQLEASRRLSVMSAAFVVTYKGERYLVVESSRGTTATVTPLAAGEQDAEVIS